MLEGTITRLDRRTTLEINDLIQRVVNRELNRHGLKATRVRCAYEANGTEQTRAEFKVEVGVIGENGEAETKFTQQWREANCRYLRLDPSWLNETYSAAGRSWTILGLNTNRRNPVLVRRDDGKTFWTSALNVIGGMALQGKWAEAANG